MLLMEEAERIAREEHGSGKIAVISGKRLTIPTLLGRAVLGVPGSGETDPTTWAGLPSSLGTTLQSRGL